MKNGRDLDLVDFPTLYRLTLPGHEHTYPLDVADCQPCNVKRELRRLLREEALACYHTAKESLYWGPTVQKIADRWSE